MNTVSFENFQQICSKELPKEIAKILNLAKGEKFCAIGFITTDDFYGCYLSWNYGKDIDAYYDWTYGLHPNFLYQPLVDIVEGCKGIDFCTPSDEKWEFALAYLAALHRCISQLPEEVFQENGVRREDVLFFATMGDGDYVQEMLDVSVTLFNAQETLKTYGLAR